MADYTGNRKRECAWGCARGIKTTWENLQFENTNQSGERNEPLSDLCFSICRFSQVVFFPRAQPHTQSLFLFPIIFGINLIHFFSMKRRTVQPEIRSFVSFLRSPVTPLILTLIMKTEATRRTRTVSKSATFLATESVNLAPFKRRESQMQIFGKETCKTLRQFQRY